DRQCGSSMQCNFNAAAAVASGQLDLVISAGVEMMSRVPRGSNCGDLSDTLSLESHRRAVAAIDAGRFENEIVPVPIAAAGAAVLLGVDETPRRDTSA